MVERAVPSVEKAVILTFHGIGRPTVTPLDDDADYWVDTDSFHRILDEVWRRYGRPILVAETGAEGENGPGWLRYVAGEVRAAARLGVPVSGLCLYPVLDYPGWENDRPCEVGLFGVADETGRRAVYEPLAEELERQRLRFEGEVAAANDERASAIRREAS